jgi:hypothetical protein
VLKIIEATNITTIFKVFLYAFKILLQGQWDDWFSNTRQTREENLLLNSSPLRGFTYQVS